ncbi:MAG: hypothetical protein FJ011_20175 [Chloroflexi bacterium]|nr:hypothetical protein [Chloroflexota bacterium]
MNVRRWAQRAWQGLQAEADAGDWSADWRQDFGGSRSVLSGLTGRSMEMAEVQAEVAAECQGQILVLGRCDEAVRGLLAHVRGQPPAPPAGPIYREGFFTLATLSDTAAAPDRPGADFGPDDGWATEELLALGHEADLLLYVYRRAAGWQAEDARWCARLHATGRPLVVVAADLDSGDPPPDPLPRREGGSGALPMRLTPVADPLGAPPADVVALAERILALRPKLGIPLAQEIPGCRPLIAQRAIRSGMLMTTLLGAEPIPLLDLPLQVALNWKLALQLAAIYGQPGLDHRSREMIGTVLWNLALRYATQQILKLAPVLGWIGSAALSGAGTWVLGNALVRHYQGAGGSGQGTGVRGLMAAAQNGEAQRRWQDAQRKGHEALAEWWAMMVQWRRDVATRATGLRRRNPPRATEVAATLAKSPFGD